MTGYAPHRKTALGSNSAEGKGLTLLLNAKNFAGLKAGRKDFGIQRAAMNPGTDPRIAVNSLPAGRAEENYRL